MDESHANSASEMDVVVGPDGGGRPAGRLRMPSGPTNHVTRDRPRS